MRLAFGLLAFAALASGQQLAVTHVNVIDVESGRVRPDSTVVISGNRIAAVGDAGTVRLPAGVEVVAGQGKFLIPGLWDMHVHMFSSLPPSAEDTSGRDFFVPRFVAAGVTGVRSMYDNLAAIQRLRKEIASGAVAGPRIVASGPILDGPRPFVAGSIPCSSAAEGRAAVNRVKQGGGDFIKVYSFLPRDAYMAIADEARKDGMAFAGHIPNSVSAAEASDAGQKSFEHLMGVVTAVSSREDASALFAKFVRNGTWQVPTLTALRAVAYFGDEKFMGDDRLQDMLPPILEFWRTGGPGMTGEDLVVRKERFQGEIDFVGAMYRAGVGILAGTDTPNPYVFPGSGLHDELELLVKAGLPPLAALQSATLRPAEYLGMTSELGTIAPGKLADLVLLDGNPLTGIASTRLVAAVILNGRLVRPARGSRP